MRLVGTRSYLGMVTLSGTDPAQACATHRRDRLDRGRCYRCYSATTRMNIGD